MHGLVLVEGETEEVFYKLIKEHTKPNARASIRGLKGNFNINKKVLSFCEEMGNVHPHLKFKVFICIDRESRYGLAQINMEYIKKELDKLPSFSSENILLFEAVQDLESWFLHDIKGIYKFLKVPVTQRKNQYKPVEKYNNRDLSELFRRFNKEYRKGERSENFQKNLNLDEIINSSAVLQELVKEIVRL